ncbi:MAG: creatininase family protein [Zetaproteobacteria bacterium]|nr:MAG: creatininase family protein [Zetaproteobacteria bacterium]
MRLAHCTWLEVETYLRHADGILIPIGSTEQHGPNGLVGTDTICPELIAENVGKRLDLMVAPAIAYGMSQHHMGFPGTISLRPTTLIKLVIDIVRSLHVHGFRNFFFLNGHGGNIAPVTSAFGELHATLPSSGMRFLLCNWWLLPEVKAWVNKQYGEDEGMHATISEVSLTQYAIPHTAKHYPCTPERAPTGPIHDASDFRRRFPDGRIGSAPQRANADDGKKICELAVSAVCRQYLEFIKTS